MRKAEFFEEKFNNFQYENYQCYRTRKEKGWTLTFIMDPLPNLSDLTYTQKRIKLQNDENHEVRFIVKYTDPKNIWFMRLYNCYKVSGRNIFRTTKITDSVRIESNKLIAKNYCSLNEFIFKFYDMDCLDDEKIPNMFRLGKNAIYNFKRNVYNNKITLKGIMNGNLTNARDIAKRYLQSQYKLYGNYNMEKVIRYLYENDDYYWCKTKLTNLKEFTTSLEGSIDFYFKNSEKREKEKLELFRDLVKDAQILDFRVNPKWSTARMEAEHQANIHKIMLATETTLSKEPITEELEIKSKGLKGRLLNNEYSVYAEAEYMHHCLYSHYFSEIKRKDYIALSINAPQRCTVGLTYDKEKQSFVVEQMQLRYNQRVADTTRNKVYDFVYDNLEVLNALAGKKNDKKKKDRDYYGCAPVPVAAGPAFNEEDLPY